ncbi:DUF3231 family protein [Neobacillus terrae]|uniref:DUF3231 family protein n=1 Tax=Neobacillus terrae TaxID=3034837 RepID=UPI00140DD035|nr:DUF3231 family protein [Neobacillus terrae]NHM30937.1 DUF3231 family protein [Neobacillus terrae]
MTEKPALSASELATLWMTFQEKTFILRFLEYIIPNADDEKSLKILTELYGHLDKYIEKLTNLFESEGAALPIAFSSKDVNVNAPKLFENGLDIMILREIKQMSMGLYTLNMGMSFREDVIDIYKDLTSITQECYKDCIQYLLEKGILTRPPHIPMPSNYEFVNDLNYLSGYNLLKKARQIDALELANIHHNMETNNVGMTLMFAFSQVAKDSDIKNYFHKGIELSRKVLKANTEFLLEDNISPTVTSIGNATNSKDSPFSDRLMMYFNYMLANFTLGANSFSFAFTLRSDIKVEFALLAKDVAGYIDEGTKLMIKNGWFEKPPQISLSYS